MIIWTLIIHHSNKHCLCNSSHYPNKEILQIEKLLIFLGAEPVKIQDLRHLKHKNLYQFLVPSPTIFLITYTGYPTLFKCMIAR